MDDGYLSPVTQADTPFTHVLLRWELAEPAQHEHEHDHEHEHEHEHEHGHETNAYHLAIRVSNDGHTWNDWHDVHPDDHMWVPSDGPKVRWSPILYAGEGMEFWQVRMVFNPDAGEAPPQLRQIDVNTIDAKAVEQAGESGTNSVQDTSRLQQSQSNGPELAEVTRPPVVSRTAWGCPDGQGSRVSPNYRFATHMVVHHTAGRNSLSSSETDWADRVRAIWAFHTHTRKWGDIGYNYIIDPNGVVYEGRAGGENAVGFHDTGNYGSMGVSLIGTYSSIAPPPSAQDSLVALLAWKALYNDIDPMGRSYYHGCYISSYCRSYAPGAVVPNIAGHREITPGHTTCPGDKVIELMPALRARVMAYIENGGSFIVQPDNGDLLIDELEDSFAKSEAFWYRAACGYGEHTYYTYATDTAEESTNSAVWRPTITESGTYHVYVHIPQWCQLDTPPYASTKASYTIHTAQGDVQRTVDHTTAEEWVDLGSYPFEAGNEGYVALSDLTGEPYRQRKVVFFDSVKWLPEGQVEQPEQAIELLDVTYGPTTLDVGELLRVSFTVRNNTDNALQSQEPQAGIQSDGSGFDTDNGYVYDENECFLGNPEDAYPVYRKQHDRFRVMLGPQNRSVVCDGESGGYPWRWGLDGALAPGETRTVTGYIRFTEPGSVSLSAGMIQEYVEYVERDVQKQTIVVKPEQQPPVVASFDSLLRPMAHMYRLGDVPENLLARNRNPLSVMHEGLVGHVPWDGSIQRWNSSFPFVIEQTRAFLVLEDGTYTFATTTDGGSWLWVDGQEVVVNNSLNDDTPSKTHAFTPSLTLNDALPASTSPVRTVTGTIELEKGTHTLSFKYFTLSPDTAIAAYMFQEEGAQAFMPPPYTLEANMPLSSAVFTEPLTLALAADDQGGSGVAKLRYSWDGAPWREIQASAQQPFFTITTPADGTHTLSYQAVDLAGNTSETQQLGVEIASDDPGDTPGNGDDPPDGEDTKRLFLPLVLR
jgi:hypothetical protein